MPLSKYISDLNALWREIQLSQHRGLVLIAGDQDWCLHTADTLASRLPNQHPILFGTRATREIPARPSSSVRQFLGQECDLLIWDAHAGLNPNELGAASGLLCGGNIMMLLLPAIEEFRVQPDSDYQRMCATEDQLNRCGLNFHNRVLDILPACTNSLYIEKGCEQGSLSDKSRADTSHDPAKKLRRDPLIERDVTLTSDQELAVDAILRVAQGHRNRPLVLTANRGRGKSSALGVAEHA